MIVTFFLRIWEEVVVFVARWVSRLLFGSLRLASFVLFGLCSAGQSSLLAHVRLIYTINIHDIMRCLNWSVYAYQLTLESNIHDVHVDVYSILVVAIWRPTFLITFLLGRTGVFLGVVHLELGLVSLLGSSDPTFLHLLLRSTPVIQTANEASIMLMAFSPVGHLGLREVVLAMASVDHGGAQHAVEVFLIKAHVVVCDRVLSVKPVLHFLTLDLLGSQHGTISRTLLCNIVSRAESLFGVPLAAWSTLSDELPHILVHVDNAAVVVWTSRDAILPLGVRRAGPHVVIVSQNPIILHPFLHIFLRVLILDVFRHRRISCRSARWKLTTILGNVRYSLRSLHFDHINMSLIKTVLNL